MSRHEALIREFMGGQINTTLRVLDVEQMLRETPPEPIGGVVYFLNAVGTMFVKVGWTSHDPHDGSMVTAAQGRARDLQTGCPFTLRVIRVIEGTRADEKRWHSALSPARIHGEWFDFAEHRRWL